MTQKTTPNAAIRWRYHPLVAAMALLAAALVATTAGPARSAESELHIKILDGRFEPATLHVPSGKRVTLTVANETGVPAEIESHDFAMEKVVPGNSQVQVGVGPLEAGEYSFFNEFAQGVTGRIKVE